MSQFYNPKRSGVWNYGGAKWKLSRSKIDLFIECPRCFYIDNKLGTKRPPGFPFNLNSAVDTLLKKEYDVHRKAKTPHPLMKEHDLDAIPFQHPDLDNWRENFKGIQYKHPETGMTISGAVDDIWIDNKTGQLLVVDYKSTSKDGEVSLDADWQIGYKRQMEVYQWLLRRLDFNVSDTGYFVYVNGRTDVPNFNERLEFTTKLLSYTGDDSWVEPIILKIQACLRDDRVPKSGGECDYCSYRETVGKTLQSKMVNKTDTAEKLQPKAGQILAEETVQKPTKLKKDIARRTKLLNTDSSNTKSLF